MMLILPSNRIEFKYDIDNARKMWLLSLQGIKVLYCILLGTVILFSFLSTDNRIWALTRGTMYDDLLIGGMNNNNDTVNNQTTLSATTGMLESQNATSEFIYGDYGNDEIQGSDRSNHLSGGPGSDVIHGNDGGDFIQGGPSIDSLYGGAGDDVLSGGEGADYFDCRAGKDSIDDFDASEGDYALSNCEIIENEGRPSQ
jgi:Ca2+-binding RTX toxin-like protein